MADSSDQMSDRTLPGRQYYREEAEDDGIRDLATLCRDIAALIYEDDGVSVGDIGAMDVDQELTMSQPPIPLLLPAPAPGYPATIDIQPRLAVQNVSMMHEQNAVHQEIHHHYPPPTSTNMGQAERDRLLVAQADELARQSMKAETMQQAGVALEQELNALQQALNAETTRAARAEAMVKELQVREAESRRIDDVVLESQNRLESLAEEFRQRDAAREQAFQRERMAWAASVKTEAPHPVPTTVEPIADSGTRATASLLFVVFPLRRHRDTLDIRWMRDGNLRINITNIATNASKRRGRWVPILRSVLLAHVWTPKPNILQLMCILREMWRLSLSKNGQSTFNML
ncbi:hypothetical protein AC1031_005799 [Aphanomyces cochlioides]|nr:hypothetical protein AC1031_005799 [Aphanomyces cochlioides]